MFYTGDAFRGKTLAIDGLELGITELHLFFTPTTVFAVECKSQLFAAHFWEVKSRSTSFKYHLSQFTVFQVL